MKLGLKEELAIKWCEEALEAIEKDPEEEELLVKAIKNYSKEKKAE
jgi:hypothetical protein